MQRSIAFACQLLVIIGKGIIAGYMALVLLDLGWGISKRSRSYSLVSANVGRFLPLTTSGSHHNAKVS